MAVYLHFDSLYRSDPYIQKKIGAVAKWYPNDNYSNVNVAPITGYEVPYQSDSKAVQTATNYRVYYGQLTDINNKRTLAFLEHCKVRPTNLTYSVEECLAVLPTSSVVPRVDAGGGVLYTSIVDEPYIFVRILPIDNAEGNLIYSNNPAARGATFIVWQDKKTLGIDESSPSSTLSRPGFAIEVADLTLKRWIIYKTCMITTMRLNIMADEWHIRLFDRFGNDIISAESDTPPFGVIGDGFDNPPAVDPYAQSTVLVGIKPNYSTI